MKFKSKKILLVIIISILLIVTGIFSFIKHKKSKYEIKKSLETQIITLSPPTDAKRVVFETERVKIGFGLTDFQENLQPEDQLLAFINERSQKNQSIQLKDAPDETRYTIQKHVADLLERGQYTLLDKTTNTYLDEIKIETYGIHCGPLCGSGGRNFILPDGESFLEVMDWVS